MSVTTDGTGGTTEPDLDEQIGAFADRLFEATIGAMEMAVAHLGRALGLYQGLRGGTGHTAAELAVATAVDTRYAREWLEHQALAGTLTVDDPAAPAEQRRYSLPEAHAVVLLDEEHPAYSGALADIPAIIARTLDTLLGAFRTGAGIPFAAYGLHDMQAGFTRPMFANSLAGEWLAALPDVHDRLQAGEALRLADFGCGEGWAAIYLAEAYPNATVYGYDLDEASIAAACKHAAERGVTDRVRFEVQDVTDPAFGERFDLVFCCEVIHDLADPVGALAAMRRLAGDEGAVLVIDERADEEYTPSGDLIQRLLYAFSILHCLPAGRDAETSAETGTVMRPSTFRGYAEAAGFTGVDELPVDNPFFRFYRPRTGATA
ncbi:MAG: class I SAM-dependent methyltransferase [Acidimicrobiia bacterium]